jgi:hypothetical protein
VNRKAVDASDEDKDNARRDLTAANIKAYIAEKVAEAPPLSIAQRESIISLLRAGGESRMIDTKPVVSQQDRDALEDRGLLPMQGYKSP